MIGVAERGESSRQSQAMGESRRRRGPPFPKASSNDSGR